MASIVADHWTPCPPGELDRLETYLRRLRAWATAATVAAALVAALALGTASYVVVNAAWPLFASPAASCSSVPANPPASE